MIPGIRLCDLNEASKHLCQSCREIVEGLHVTSIEDIPVDEKLLKLRTRFCKNFGVTEMDLVRRSNTALLVDARRQFAALARAHGFSFPEIGKAVSRHHASVIALLQYGETFKRKKNRGWAKKRGG